MPTSAEEIGYGIGSVLNPIFGSSKSIMITGDDAAQSAAINNYSSSTKSSTIAIVAFVVIALAVGAFLIFKNKS